MRTILLIALSCIVSPVFAQPATIERNVARSKATLAQAIAEAAWKDGETVTIQGRASAGDGGSSSYIYHRTGRTGVTIDNGFYISGGGSDDYLEAINKKIAKPEMFGATGDGVTDDSAALQAAIDSGKPVLLEQSYAIETGLTASTAGQRIYGTGTIIDTTDAPGLAAMLTLDGDADYAFVEGLTFQGPLDQTWWDANTGAIPGALPLTGGASTDAFKKGVYMRGDSQKVVRCRFSGKQNGAYIRLGASSCTIQSCVFEGIFTSTPAGGANYHIAFGSSAQSCVIDNNIVRNAGSMVAFAAGSNYNTVTHNLGTTLYDNGIYGSTSSNTTVSNNTIKDALGNSGIKVRGSGYAVVGNSVNGALVGIQVTPNTGAVASEWQDGVIRFSSGSVAPQVGETLTGATSSASGVVKAVHYDAGTWAGGDATGWIELDTSTTGWDAETINGNYGGTNILTSDGYLVGGYANVISGNTVTGATSIGLAAIKDEDYWQHGVVVTDNTVNDSGGSGFPVIRVQAHDAIVANNVINGYVAVDLLGAIQSLGGINIKILNNTITGSPDVGLYFTGASPGIEIIGNTITAATTISGASQDCVIDQNTLNGTVSLGWPGGFKFRRNRVKGKLFCSSTTTATEAAGRLEIIGNDIQATGVAVEHLSSASLDEAVIANNRIESLSNGSSYAFYWRLNGAATQAIGRFRFNGNTVVNYSASAGIFPFTLTKGTGTLTIDRCEFRGNQIYGNRGAITLNVEDSGQLVMSDCYFQRTRLNSSAGENIGNIAGFTRQTLNGCVFGYPSDSARMDTLSIDPDGDAYITNCSFEGMTDAATFSASVDNVFWTNNALRGTASPDISAINGAFVSDNAQGHAEISIEDNATATTVASTQSDWSAKSQFVGFGSDFSDSLYATPDHTNDHITLTSAGTWEVSCVVTLSGSVVSDLWELALWKNNGATQVSTKQGVNIRGAGLTYEKQVTISGLVDASANDTIELWVQRTNGTGSITITNAVMTAKKVSD